MSQINRLLCNPHLSDFSAAPPFLAMKDRIISGAGNGNVSLNETLARRRVFLVSRKKFFF